MKPNETLESTDSVQGAEEPGWFTRDVYPHDASLKAYLRGSFPKVRDVDDVVQESYLRLWKAYAVQPIVSAKAFLFTVARRVALDLVRRQQRSPINHNREFEQVLAYDHAPDAADNAVRAQEVELLAAAVAALPPRCREIFVLRRFQGVSQKEIAMRLSLSEQTVQVQVARGLRKVEGYLRRKLEERP